MHKIVDVWRRLNHSNGYAYRVIVQVDKTTGQIIILSYCEGPRGGIEPMSTFALSLAEWAEINTKVVEELAG